MTVKGFWVYTHTTPDGFVYVGRSGQNDTNKRWHSGYKNTALQAYIERFGFDNLTHEVVKDGLTKEQSYQLEDELIRKYSALGICLNKYGSGGLKCNGKWIEYNIAHREERLEYNRQYHQAHHEELLEHDRQYYQAHREKCIERSRKYRETHRDEILDDKRQYYIAHREEKLDYLRQYRESHRDELNSKQRARYAANRDEINARRRAKRAAKRAAKVSPKFTTPVTKPNTQPSDYQWGDPLF